MSKYAIAYDVGTTGIKTCLIEIDQNIKIISSASQGYKLYVLDAPELVKATDYLASMIHENGSFASSWDEELDITGWVVEALSLVNQNKYQSVLIIKKEQNIISRILYKRQA